MIYLGVTEKNGRKRSCLKRIRGYDLGEEGGGSRHSLLGIDKNYVLADKVLSYF